MTLDRQTSESDRSSRKYVRFGGWGSIVDDPSVTWPADLDRDAVGAAGRVTRESPAHWRGLLRSGGRQGAGRLPKGRLVRRRALLQADVPAGSGPGTSTCMLRRIGLLGFKVAPMLDLRVAPTSTDCTFEMLSFRVYVAASSSNVCSDPRLFWSEASLV